MKWINYNVLAEEKVAQDSDKEDEDEATVLTGTTNAVTADEEEKKKILQNIRNNDSNVNGNHIYE